MNACLQVVDAVILYWYSAYEEERSVVGALRPDGSSAWTFDRDWTEHPIICRGTVYAGGSHARRIDLTSGRILAERHLGAHLTICSATPSVVAFSDSTRVIGVDPLDLSPVWEFPDPDEQLTVHVDRLCRYTQDGRMSHVDLPTLRESAPVQAPAPPSPLHAHVGPLWCFLSETGRCAIDERTGRVRWEYRDTPFGPFAYAGNRAYSGGGGGLTAFDLENGISIWHQPCGRQPRELWAAPHVEDGRIYAVSRDRHMLVVDAATGELLLSQEIDFRPEALRPLGTERLIAGDSNKIVCFELSEEP